MEYVKIRLLAGLDRRTHHRTLCVRTTKLSSTPAPTDVAPRETVWAGVSAAAAGSAPSQRGVTRGAGCLTRQQRPHISRRPLPTTSIVQIADNGQRMNKR